MSDGLEVFGGPARQVGPFGEVLAQQAVGVLDTLGRTLTVPAAETGPGAASILTATYRANDMVSTLSQDVTVGGATETRSTSFDLDPSGRVSGITKKTNGIESSRLRYRYSSPGDSPTSIQASTDNGSTWTTSNYVALDQLGFAVEIANSNSTYQLTNLNGDVVATADASGAVGSYGETDEYGNRISGPTTRRYGWLGSSQRSAGDANGGLVLMGARLYNPATGAFLSADAIQGANATPYTYPQDPVNGNDTTGGWPNFCGKTCRKWIWRGIMAGVTAAVGGICSAAISISLLCDIIGGAVVGAIDYFTYRKFVSKKPTYWDEGFKYAMNNAYRSIGSTVFSKVVSRKLKDKFWREGQHIGKSIRRKLESFHMDWLGAFIWTAWQVAVDAVIAVIGKRTDKF